MQLLADPAPEVSTGPWKTVSALIYCVPSCVHPLQADKEPVLPEDTQNSWARSQKPFHFLKEMEKTDGGVFRRRSQQMAPDVARKHEAEAGRRCPHTWVVMLPTVLGAFT
jgi:hypothetical protein